MRLRTHAHLTAIWLALIVAAAPIPPLFPARVAAQAQVLAALPQTFLNATYGPPSGNVITVPAGGDFQSALNDASPGDTITLAAGATYTGTFNLPAKSGSGWIYIQSSALSSLPAPGTRVSPTQASAMPKILGPSGSLALWGAPGAHHFRFVGIEFSPAPWAIQHTLMRIGTDAASISALPHDITFDRCYIHGDPNQGGTLWGLLLDGRSVAVIDSYLSNWRAPVIPSDPSGNETTALKIVNGAGPYKITNNFIEAAGQSVMFGGQDPAISGVIPADIEIRGNYMTKRLAWREFDPSFAGTLVTVKEVFELKNARRVLIDGNIFEHSWKSSDHDGHAIQFTPRDQTGGAPWSLVEDVTFTHNIVRQATNGFFTLGTDYTFPSGPLQRVLIQNNLIYDIGSFPENGAAYWFGALVIMRDGVTGAIFDHNTAFQSGDVLHAAVANHTPNTGLVFTNNIGDGNVSSEAASGVGAVAADPATDPAAALATSFPGVVFTRNILLNGNTSAYPPDNWFPPGVTPIATAYYGGEDYHLVPGSPYHNAAPAATPTATPTARAAGAEVGESSGPAPRMGAGLRPSGWIRGLPRSIWKGI